MTLRLVPILCLLLAAPGYAMAEEQLDDIATAEMQKHFVEGYNRGDVDAMDAAFADKAVRVTPSGIFQGRDAIRQGFHDALETRLFGSKGHLAFGGHLRFQCGNVASQARRSTVPRLLHRDTYPRG